MRSVGLAAVGVALLVAALGLGVLLVHDGESRSVTLGTVAPGDDIEVKGETQPFFPDNLAAWLPLRPLLGNFTSLLQAEDALVLLSSEEPLPPGVVVAEGTVSYVGTHPTESDLHLVVLHVTTWREPLVFR